MTAANETYLSNLIFVGFSLVGWALLWLDRTLVTPPPVDPLGDVQVFFLLLCSVVSLIGLWAVHGHMVELHAFVDGYKNRRQSPNNMEVAKMTSLGDEQTKDEERLRKIEPEIAEIVDLIASGTTRSNADAKIEEQRMRVESDKGEPRPLARVFHDHGGKRIPTTRRTQVAS